MREIEFRGKQFEGGEYVSGNLIQWENRAFINYMKLSTTGTYRNKWIEVIPETVGQYTGLKDRNGKKVFEGAIVRHKGFGVKQATWGSDYDSLSKCCGFMWNFTIAFLSTNETDRCEVIGNIHDNPELLKDDVNA